MKLSPKLLCASLLFTSVTATADFIGVYAGVGFWQAAPAGNVGRTDIALDSTLNLSEDTNQFAYVAFEHPIPLLPNFRVQHSELDWAGTALIEAGTDLNGSPFTSTQQADISLDLTHTDATLYYEVLDNIIDLDLGITARMFDGEASLVGATQQENVDLGATVPLLYGKVGFMIPTTGLSADVSANWVNVDDFRLIDWSAQLIYDIDLLPAVDMAVVLGYRLMVIELDDLDELQSDATFDGYFLALRMHF
ncbi:MAG: Uncharacterised protein [SAR92 bacterium MED-G29]|jgi:outer membrane protein|nr:MAG: Uncharacterised protein [SAR92 bacterium MED-G29]|tara:strand:+ start:935 stop:1684 length:750 start_codon:yes stop_codon:yes gene_type:complete